MLRISLSSIIRAAVAKILSQIKVLNSPQEIEKSAVALPEEGQAHDRIRPADLGC